MKRNLFFLFLSLVISAIASAQIRYAVIPETSRPGEPVTIGIDNFALTGGAKEALLFVNGRQLAKSAFFSVPAEAGKPGFLAAIITIPSTANPGNAIIRVNSEAVSVLEIPITISARNFVAEVIELNPVLTGIRTDPDPKRTEESNKLWAILSTNGSQIYHAGFFVPPVSSTRRTSFFGDRRVYKYSNGTSDTSIHAGVDFGVPKGTSVSACAAGKVVLARMRIVTGNSVVIEHAPGIYSLYYHLDSISVKEGDMVYTGAQIGLSGSTGLSTGPHLHWEIRVSTENTDPDSFISRPIIDKDLIISKIYHLRLVKEPY
jgi:murein DD-endopeptidase MepM/ murein hydrolase activator NlpD